MTIVHGNDRAAVRRRPLRVCHVAYTFYDVDNRVKRYARALADCGAEVDVIALRRPGQPRVSEADGVRISHVQYRSPTEGSPWTYLAKILSFMLRALVLLSCRQLRRPYDIVHVHNVPDFLVFAAAVPKVMRAAVILDIHDILPELYAGKFGASNNSVVFRCLLMVERLSCWFANRVIVANHLWYDRLIERAVPASKCAAILNYPDLRIFKPLAAGGERCDGKFVIVYPGSLSRHQGVDVAIRGFALMMDQMPDAVLHIYGEGPAKSELVELSRTLNLNGRVEIRDAIPIERVAEVMASADVGIEPKLANGFGNEALSTKILEFMACRVPVIASRTMAHAHYFDESVITFFTSGDERQLGEALLHHYNHRTDMTSKCRAQEFAAGYAWQRRCGDYYQIIESLSSCVPLFAGDAAVPNARPN